MRAAPILVVALLLPLAPATLAMGDQAHFRLLDARLDDAMGTNVAGVELWNDHFTVTMTIVNDGAAGRSWLGLDEWWHLNDLPLTVWYDEIHLAAGEVRTVVADVWVYQMPEYLRFSQGPVWYCLTVSMEWTARCWSRFAGPIPAEHYPEDIPNWQLLDAQYGDGPQE